MKIICAGFMKTGTKSLAKALQILGYCVFDFEDQLIDLGPLWTKFFNGTVTDDDIRSSLENIDAIVDGPAIAFWEEISRAIPEAKIILTIRDEDSWWSSFQKQMRPKNAGSQIFVALTMLLTPSGNRFLCLGLRVARYCFGTEGLFQLPFFSPSSNSNPRLHKFKFRQHNSHVLHSVPKDKLLVYPVGSGWGPLCEFLNVEEPVDVPYPHLNRDASHFDEQGGIRNPKFRRFGIELFFVTIPFLSFVSLLSYYLMSRLF